MSNIIKGKPGEDVGQLRIRAGDTRLSNTSPNHKPIGWFELVETNMFVKIMQKGQEHEINVKLIHRPKIGIQWSPLFYVGYWECGRI